MMYAVPASYRGGSTWRTDPHVGMPGIPAVTLLQLLPPSRVTWTRPSFVPTQISPACRRDSAIAYTTSPYSTPMLSGGSPPEICCLDLSLRVRSGLMTRQLRPPSADMWTNWLPVYTVLWSWGEMVNGGSHTKRYCTAAAGCPPVRSGHTSTFWPCRVRSSKRTTIPPRLPDPDAVDQMMFGSTGS